MYHASPSSPHNYQHSRPSMQLPLPAPLSLSIQSPRSQNYPSYMSQTNPASPPVQTPGQASNHPPEESPTAVAEVNDEGNYNIPTPPPVCKRWQGMLWKIEVIQNPLRARMCGFGDKDRRPISPPPAVLLTIWDPSTGAEIDYRKISDLSKLILIVDLWNLHGTREDNCVRHTTTSPSISTTTVTSFPYTYTGKIISNPAVDYDPSRIPSYMSTYADQVIPVAPNSGAPVRPTNGSQPNYANGSHACDARNSAFPNNNNNNQPSLNAPFHGNYDQSPSALVSPQSMTSSSRSSQDAIIVPNGSHRDSRDSRDSRDNRETTIARNLIGNTTASANLLHDENGKHGIWFVLQDLSVRTEGWFRLKVNLFNLAQPPVLEEENSNSSNNDNNTNTGQPSANHKLLQEAPLLASAFSKPFKVFSAKKFPGVIESTNLSRTFAKQGIKIPIRKDHGGKKRKAGADSDDDDSDE